MPVVTVSVEATKKFAGRAAAETGKSALRTLLKDAGWSFHIAINESETGDAA